MEICRALARIQLMKPTYKHTQSGAAMVIAMLVCSLIVIVAYIFNRDHGVILLALVPFLAGAVIFCSLTIQVSKDSVSWNFGPGFLSKSISIKEIAAAEPVQNRWYSGWGIHYAGGEWIYNVSGADAVRLTLKSGQRLRLGTEEPEALTAAIRSMMA